MSRMMNHDTIRAINSALLFTAKGTYEKPEVRPWQYVQMEYERVGLVPPAGIPQIKSIEDAEIWMCLDSRYNSRLRETGWLQAV